MAEGSEYKSTVGKAFGDHQIYSVNHPEYIQFANAVELELSRIAEREAGRQSDSHSLVLTTTLSTGQLADLNQFYPEFMLKVVPLNSAVQPYWSASRLCANEWIAQTTSRYASEVVHYGASNTATMMGKRRGWHVEVNSSDEVQMHAEYGDAVDMHRLYGDYLRVKSEYGIELPRSEYEAYLRREQYTVCYSPHDCTHQADGMCVDLTAGLITPEQVAIAMNQHGSKVCHGFFVYCPEMLVQQTGALGSSGLSFARRAETIHLSYPEGVAGTTSMRLDIWARWLASHCFRVGRRWFQLELLKNRDAFMFFRMAVVSAPAGGFMVRHALDMDYSDEYVLVESWKLKHGLASDPSLREDWVANNFLVRSRVERRVREFAMQLDQKNFSRYAIKKQIRVVNNRFVVSGSQVTVMPVMEPQQIEDLATAIFSRVFVERYESSSLSSHMMASLKKAVNFHELTFAARTAMIASIVCRWLGASTLGAVDSKVRGASDAIRDYFDHGMRHMSVSVKPAPTYISLRSYCAGWKSIFLAGGGERFYTDTRRLNVDMVSDVSIGGSLASVASGLLPITLRLGRDITSVVRLVTDVCDVSEVKREGPLADAFVDGITSINEVDPVTAKRSNLAFTVATHATGVAQGFRLADDPDPVGTLNEAYAEVLPAMVGNSVAYDPWSLSLDPQDRVLAAPYLRMGTYFGLPPAPRSYYPSRLNALNVPKRQNIAQELLSAVAARNLSAPAIALPQEDAIIPAIWDNFLDVMCVADARERLAEFRQDPVAMSEDALREWAAKSKPGALEAIVGEMKTASKALGDMPVREYLVMLKADAKPVMTEKPVSSMTAPQVIVYHERLLSAMYSSMIRVLVRRFLSLLKDSVMVNLLKDIDGVAKHVASCHPFDGDEGVQYLENDFSKFDKSQSEFAFRLEEFVFYQLGLNQAMLEKWALGHVDCTLRSVACGLSLHVMYQRKSGDATTAFGNVILNVLSVAYAYRGSVIVWAVFMGDDSLVCATKLNTSNDSVQILAEVFNLSAKFYITDAPYFASHFLVVSSETSTVGMVPDPVKRIERLSMHISADDPQWDERYTSFCDTMKVFLQHDTCVQVVRAIPQRYKMTEGNVRAVACAFGTMVRSKAKFRACWAEFPEVLQG